MNEGHFKNVTKATTVYYHLEVNKTPPKKKKKTPVKARTNFFLIK